MFPIASTDAPSSSPERDRERRDHTDESLRVEREKVDVGSDERRETLDEQADEVVRTARRRADEVVQTARSDADRERSSRSRATDESSERARTRADAVLEHERAQADSILAHERAERRLYLADFREVEREATNLDLVGERAHADSALAVRDELLATVAHDLRGLLTGLSLNAALLVRHAPLGADGDEMRSYGARSQRLLGRMNRLVSDLLDVASIEAGKLVLFPEVVCVGNILRDAIDAFETIASAKRIALSANAEAKPLHARLDGHRVLQVLANLLSNAIKFTPAEGHVSLRLSVVEDGIQFAVSDTGKGIPETELPGVFERFRQVSNDRRGLGLGLHISKCIVAAHGGKMWAESTLGVGSTFYVVLPALR